MGSTEKKILAGLGLAALVATGFGAAGVGPLAGMMGAGAGAAGATGAAGAAGGTTAAGLGSLLAKSAASGAGSTLAGAGLSALTPEQKMTQVIPGQVPQMTPQEDPFEMFQKIMRQSGGRI